MGLAKLLTSMLKVEPETCQPQEVAVKSMAGVTRNLLAFFAELTVVCVSQDLSDCPCAPTRAASGEETLFWESTQHPIDFPDWCEAHYDSQTCQISVVQKANPSLPCVKSVEHEWGSAGTPEPLVNKLLGTGLSR
ncbi:hypothetical protein DUI87_06487 [Hirundo rustica rustica]|uniref:Uncharacterized protein n=1 Tax=Hirundo rustica rustica TaxID=333673 RepID=A0A3M0L0M1_HIRRU|nr:hypothetical protein DUI87_06487 [Hirundo rustica rustica]